MYICCNDFKQRCGEISDEEFIRRELTARKQIDYFTSNRITEDVKRYGSADRLPYFEELCGIMCELIALNKLEDSENIVQSASNDGYSETYSVSTKAEIAERRRKLIRMYLGGCSDFDGVPLLYAGV